MQLELETKNIHNKNKSLIRIDYDEAGKNSPLLIIIHGFKGFKDWGFFPYLTKELNLQGISTLKFNFSHNGVGSDLLNFNELDKFKFNSLSQEVFELESIFNFVINSKQFSNINKDRISFLGHSRGAYSTIVAGNKLDIHKAISLAGISSLPKVPSKQEKEWRKNTEYLIENSRTKQMMPLGTFLLEDLLSKSGFFEESIKSFDKPLLIIHGEEDPTVPLESGLSLNKKVKNSKIEIIKDADHVFNIKHPFNGTSLELDQAIKRVVSFLIEVE